MPRKAPQPPRAANNQEYGERGAQIEAQQQMPLPQNRGSSPDLGGPARLPAPTGPPVDAMAQMNVPLPNGLATPTERPDEPVTAGLPIGLGSNSVPGVQQTSQAPLSELFYAVAEATGDDRFAQLAIAAREEGK